MTARRLFIVSAYGVAMGFLEAAVVVYLRRLYYPGGFEFPLVPLPLSITLVEVGRELATLLMLWAVAVLAGRTGRERFAWFCFLFGAWDIVYYVGLKVVLGWPASLFTWDVLFLVPLIWAGPVLAPLLISLALIGTALLILRHEARRICIHLLPADRLALGAALLLCLYAFMANHPKVYAGGMPAGFPWIAFVAGMAIALGVVAKALLRNPRTRLSRRHAPE